MKQPSVIMTFTTSFVGIMFIGIISILFLSEINEPRYNKLINQIKDTNCKPAQETMLQIMNTDGYITSFSKYKIDIDLDKCLKEYRKEKVIRLLSEKDNNEN